MIIALIKSLIGMEEDEMAQLKLKGWLYRTQARGWLE